jgi:hypothetical protein
MHVVGERALAVDLDDRQPLSVASLQLGVAGDVDLLQLEGVLGTHRIQDPPRRRAQMATGRVVEGDALYGYSPRVIVASATR